MRKHIQIYYRVIIKMIAFRHWEQLRLHFTFPHFVQMGPTHQEWYSSQFVFSSLPPFSHKSHHWWSVKPQVIKEMWCHNTQDNNSTQTPKEKENWKNNHKVGMRVGNRIYAKILTIAREINIEWFKDKSYEIASFDFRNLKNFIVLWKILCEHTVN